MRKILRKYIIAMFTLSSILMISIHLIMDIIIARRQQVIMSDYKISRIINIIERRNYDEERFKKRISEEYLIRAKAIVNIIDSENNLTSNNLSNLCMFFKVSEIDIFDKEGKIYLSSNANKKNKTLKDEYKASNLLKFFNSKNLEYYMYNNENSLEPDEKYKIYIALKSKLDNIGLIKVSLIPEQIIEYKSNNSITSTLNRVPIDDIIMVFSISNKKLLFAPQNTQNYLITESERKIKDISFEKSSKIKHEVGKRHFASYKTYNDYYIVYLVPYSEIFKDIKVHILTILISMFLIYSVGIYIIDKKINKNILVNIEEINDVLNNIEQGNLNARLKEKGCPEIFKIKHIINNIISLLTNMNNRLEKVVMSTNLPISLFEYIGKINQLLITKNTKDILDLDEEQWLKIKDDGLACKNLLLSIKNSPFDKETDVYFFNNKFFKFNIIEDNNGYFGFLQDVTHDIIEKENILSELVYTQSQSKIDALTGLINKGEMIKIITSYLSLDNCEGVLILFDLDNFKTVNDTKGHPEGDKLLKLFAETIKYISSPESFVARFGGDEFAIFIQKEMSNKEITKLLEFLITKIRVCLSYYYTLYNVSVSIGACKTNGINNFESLYELADSRLYIAKKTGKDKYFLE